MQQTCADRGVDDDVCSTAVLLTSETVTNAFVHGRSEARRAVTTSRNTVHVEVGDDNPRHPYQADPDPDALDGRGLTILDLLATTWGVRDETYGKVVWFDVAIAS